MDNSMEVDDKETNNDDKTSNNDYKTSNNDEIAIFVDDSFVNNIRPLVQPYYFTPLKQTTDTVTVTDAHQQQLPIYEWALTTQRSRMMLVWNTLTDKHHEIQYTGMSAMDVTFVKRKTICVVGYAYEDFQFEHYIAILANNEAIFKLFSGNDVFASNFRSTSLMQKIHDILQTHKTRYVSGTVVGDIVGRIRVNRPYNVYASHHTLTEPTYMWDLSIRCSGQQNTNFELVGECNLREFETTLFENRNNVICQFRSLDNFARYLYDNLFYVLVIDRGLRLQDTDKNDAFKIYKTYDNNIAIGSIADYVEANLMDVSDWRVQFAYTLEENEFDNRLAIRAFVDSYYFSESRQQHIDLTYVPKFDVYDLNYCVYADTTDGVGYEADEKTNRVNNVHKNDYTVTDDDDKSFVKILKRVRESMLVGGDEIINDNRDINAPVVMSISRSEDVNEKIDDVVTLTEEVDSTLTCTTRKCARDRTQALEQLKAKDRVELSFLSSTRNVDEPLDGGDVLCNNAECDRLTIIKQTKNPDTNSDRKRKSTSHNTDIRKYDVSLAPTYKELIDYWESLDVKTVDRVDSSHRSIFYTFPFKAGHFINAKNGQIFSLDYVKPISYLRESVKDLISMIYYYWDSDNGERFMSMLHFAANMVSFDHALSIAVHARKLEVLAAALMLLRVHVGQEIRIPRLQLMNNKPNINTIHKYAKYHTIRLPAVNELYRWIRRQCGKVDITDNNDAFDATSCVLYKHFREGEPLKTIKLPFVSNAVRSKPFVQRQLQRFTFIVKSIASKAFSSHHAVVMCANYSIPQYLYLDLHNSVSNTRELYVLLTIMIQDTNNEILRLYRRSINANWTENATAQLSTSSVLPPPNVRQQNISSSEQCKAEANLKAIIYPHQVLSSKNLVTSHKRDFFTYGFREPKLHTLVSTGDCETSIEEQCVYVAVMYGAWIRKS
ncbi:gp76 [Phenacoccus solenopsis nudivirus]|nr:gp76 [Phenacoccus solenopsis nudivirus]